MPPLSLPHLYSLNSVANWRRWWPGDAAGALEDVRLRLAAAVEPWKLGDLRPIGRGEVAVVLAGHSGGRDVVVKANPRIPGRTDELAGEAAALAFWASTAAAATPLGIRDDGATILLERLRPGASLQDARLGETATLETLGALVARLHAAGLPPAGDFAHLRASSLGRDMTAALEGQPEADELAELLSPEVADSLIHADLHSFNALQAGGAFKAIDPKPHLADRHADIFALLYGPYVALPAGRRDARALAVERVTRYAKAAHLDADRARAWTRVRALSAQQWVATMSEPGEDELRWAHELGRLAASLR